MTMAMLRIDYECHLRWALGLATLAMTYGSAGITGSYNERRSATAVRSVRSRRCRLESERGKGFIAHWYRRQRRRTELPEYHLTFAD